MSKTYNFLGDPKVKKEIHSHGPGGFEMAAEDHFKETFDECVKNGKNIMEFHFNSDFVVLQTIQRLMSKYPGCKYSINGEIYKKPVWSSDYLEYEKYWEKIKNMPNTTIQTLLVKI